MARRRSQLSHLWGILLALLGLLAIFLGELFVNPADQTSAGEVAPSLPTLSPPGGYYDRDIQVEIGLLGQGNVIFTVDGRVPSLTTGTAYEHPIYLSASAPGVTVIRARAILPDGELGPIVSASYFVGLKAYLPLLSLVADPVDLWDAESGICANPYERGLAWERPVDVTFVDRDRQSGFHVGAGLRVHGGNARGDEKKSFRLYFRREYGPAQLEYPLFGDSDVQSFERLVLHTSGQDWCAYPHSNWTLMRNQIVERLTHDINGPATHSRPVLVFINGQAWGIYHLRERIDQFFLAGHYGIDSTDLLTSPENGVKQEVKRGDRAHWDHLMAFVESHDLAQSHNYTYVESQVDLANLIDYFIIQIYAANTDWPHHNMQLFRPRVQGGRWHWIVWDCDYCFGANLLSRVDTNMIAWVLEMNHPETNGRNALLFRKLLENPTFRERFLARMAALLNTVLTPKSVIAHVDDLAAEMELDIAYETTRWLGTQNLDEIAPQLGLDRQQEAIRWISPQRWEDNVAELREFARLRPDFVRQHVVEGFGLSGMASLTVDAPDEGVGSVAINGTLVSALPWRGTYFQDVSIQMVAAPEPGYRFAGWEPAHLPQTPRLTLTLREAQTLTPRFERLADAVPRPGDVVFSQYRMDGDGEETSDWFELQVQRPGGVDLRGWRVTDNDAKAATDEGSLIFPDDDAFAHVPRGTRIRVNVHYVDGDERPSDDLGTWDFQMTLYVENGNLETRIDPGFNLGEKDNLVLLAPGDTGTLRSSSALGSSSALADDVGIAFVAEGDAVTPVLFGVLVDGVRPE